MSLERKNEKMIEQLAEAQLAGPSYLDDAGHAKIVIGALPQQPHELPALAAASVTTVNWSKAWTSLADALKEATQIKAVGELDSKTYETLHDKMTSGSSSSIAQTSQKSVPKPAKQVTPEEKAANEAAKVRAKLLLSCQGAISKYSNLMCDKTVGPLIQKIEKSWASVALPRIHDQIEQLHLCIKDLHKLWSDQAANVSCLRVALGGLIWEVSFRMSSLGGLLWQVSLRRSLVGVFRKCPLESLL